MTRQLLMAIVAAAPFVLRAQEPAVVAGFHHVHLNSTDHIALSVAGSHRDRARRTVASGFSRT
jgi:hypothetical protein